MVQQERLGVGLRRTAQVELLPSNGRDANLIDVHLAGRIAEHDLGRAQIARDAPLVLLLGDLLAIEVDPRGVAPGEGHMVPLAGPPVGPGAEHQRMGLALLEVHPHPAVVDVPIEADPSAGKDHVEEVAVECAAARVVGFDNRLRVESRPHPALERPLLEVPLTLGRVTDRCQVLVGLTLQTVVSHVDDPVVPRVGLRGLDRRSLKAERVFQGPADRHRLGDKAYSHQHGLAGRTDVEHVRPWCGGEARSDSRNQASPRHSSPSQTNGLSGPW